MATITAGTRNHTRKLYLAAACGALLALTVAAVIGTWRLSDHGGTSTASVAVEQAQPATLAAPADTLGGVAERTRIQAELAAPQPDTMGGVAERTRIQQQLDDQAQASVMGGVAERITIQDEMAAGPR